MTQAEMVTVRMSRGNIGTPWGFDIGPNLNIIDITGGSLADRAGLLNGDTVVELEGHQDLRPDLAKQLLSKAEHKIELVVHRKSSGLRRTWQPSITENAEYNKFQHSVHSTASEDASHEGSTKQPQPINVPLKVSLEHQHPEQIAIPGYNVAAQPYGDHQEVKHLQYNSPMPIYSPQSAAEQYLQQTGGLFGTDPKLSKAKEIPSYLRSETLRLIQESERSKEDSSSHIHPVSVPISINREQMRSSNETNSGLPVCYICGRNIVGVMCSSNDRTMHGDCFQCSTCGSSLKNQGHHFINDKFYCDVHGRQIRGGVAGRDQSELTTTRSPINLGPIKESHRTSYQPEVMARRPLSISPTPWKTSSPISPSNRGVPPAQTHYGQELNDLRKEMYSSSVVTEVNKYGYHPSGGIEKRANGNAKVGHTKENYVCTPSEKIITSIMEADKRDSNRNFYTTATNIHEHTGHGNDTARRRGVLHTQGGRIPFCDECKQEIRGAYVLANGLTYCPDHFVCANKSCGRKLLEIGFVEDKGRKYCERCFETQIAPRCAKCSHPITADCLNALQKQWHPHCFVCAHCHKPFGNSAFFLEQGQPYCEADWNALFTTKCVSCHYPIEAGDRWVEALGAAFHSNCFNCTSCNVNLEGESFYAKDGAPYCKLHA